MGAKVFANGMEISGKASDNKTIAAMPDVCLSPPSPPAGPLPIPYPNFAQASDTTDGSKTVKIGGKEIGLKGKSSYKKSKGDEAATRSFGASVVSHTIQGSVKHEAGSMDVKVEGSNVVRFGDLTTGNHSNPGLPPTAQVAKGATGGGDAECAALEDMAKEAPKNSKSGTHKNGRTFAAAQYKPPRGPRWRTTSTSHMSEMKNKNGMAQGQKDGNTFKETKMCAAGKKKLRTHKKKGKKYVEYGRSDNQGGMCHAESRIIEDVFKKFGASPGGTLTFSIRQKKSNGRLLKEPCEEHCHEMLCAAKECNIKIKICRNGKPEDLECPDS
jgi:uncharacterized Zn-binding protein involved in type VI secretion